MFNFLAKLGGGYNLNRTNHNVHPTAIIRNMKKDTRTKDAKNQCSKNVCFCTSFGRLKLVTMKTERLSYVQILRLYDVKIYVHIAIFISFRQTDLNTTFI